VFVEGTFVLGRGSFVLAEQDTQYIPDWHNRTQRSAVVVELYWASDKLTNQRPFAVADKLAGAKFAY